MNTNASAEYRFSNEVRYRTNEHPNQRQLTPGYVLIPVRHALGGEIDLDPCTEPDNPTAALRYYTEADDGLTSPWNANTIYCNPPYGKAREPWVKLCIAAGERGAKVILLIPSHTDTRVVQSCFQTASSAAFIKGRVKFGVLRNNGRQEAASHPSVLFGWNVNLSPACDELGYIVTLRNLEEHECAQ
jgi:phage N-6-adenine-methyltransferase